MDVDAFSAPLRRATPLATPLSCRVHVSLSNSAHNLLPDWEPFFLIVGPTVSPYAPSRCSWLCALLGSVLRGAVDQKLKTYLGSPPESGEL